MEQGSKIKRYANKLKIKEVWKQIKAQGLMKMKIILEHLLSGVKNNKLLTPQLKSNK